MMHSDFEPRRFLWGTTPLARKKAANRRSPTPSQALAAAATVAFSVTVALHTDTALAAGYGVGQESAAGMGTAYAGGAAAANDPSTVWYNPAGMTKIKGSQLMVGGTGIFPVVDYDEQGSTLFNGAAYSGGEGGDGGQDAFVPHLYGVHTLDNGIKVGIGINSPFGLVTDYDLTWKGRYSEITTALKSVNINPAVAAQVLPGLSVGGGVSVQYLRGNLLQAIDFGSLCTASLGAGACAGFGLTAGQTDGQGKVIGEAVGYGFNVGALYELDDDTRFGAHYRSRMTFNFDGEASFQLPNGARAFLNAAGLPTAFKNGVADFQLVEPEMASISAYHRLNEKWAVMGDITWTRWGVFDFLLIEVKENQTPDNLLLTDWENVFRYSAGATYDWSEKLTLRGGLAFDDSPIDTAFRGPGIPDSDRIVFAIGFGYAIAEDLWLDAGYQHLFFKTGNTRRISGTNSVLSGDFDVDVDAFGLALTWKW